MPSPDTLSTVPPSNVLDLPNATTIVIREIDDTLYLDAYNLSTGGCVAVALNEASESVLRAILDMREARRRMLGKAGTP